MRLRSFITLSPSTLLRTSLLTVILLVSCAPAEAPTPAELEIPVGSTALVNEPPDPTPTQSQPLVVATDMPPTKAPVELVQPVATSRGPNLEATDPASVSLASGDLQLVEFFRFT